MPCKERVGIWVIHSVGSSYCARRCHIASRIERFTAVGGMRGTYYGIYALIMSSFVDKDNGSTCYIYIWIEKGSTNMN
jgi:hypothetical protein